MNSLKYSHLRPRVKNFSLIFTLLLAGLTSCSDDTTVLPDSGAEAGGKPGLAGIIKDGAGKVVQGVKVEAGGKSVYTDLQGAYTLSGLTPGLVTVKLSQDWFQPQQQTATVKASGITFLDLTIQEWPLKIEAADQALAVKHQQSFDWTQHKTSVVIVDKPTRKDLDNAIYFQNPALLRDISKEKDVTPSPQPTIVSAKASNFTFPAKSDPHKGVEVLDTATIADAIKDTPITAAEQSARLLWSPMRTWLTNWDATKSLGISAVGVAVRQQSWGTNAVLPQDIESVYIHNQEIWVKVIFEDFVKLGAGITDTDHKDKRVEIFARVNSKFYTAEILTKLQTDYIKPTFNTHGLSLEIGKSLNELYSTTAAAVEKYIGQPYTVPNLGTINYPFVVLKHSGGARNVLLIGP